MPIDVSELEDALDAHQLAARLHMSVRSARRRLYNHEIESIKIGRGRLVTQRMLRDYLERSRIKAEPPSKRRQTA